MSSTQRKPWVTPEIVPTVPPEKTLIVGITADGREVVINHPNIQAGPLGYGYTFSPDQARNLARLLIIAADEINNALDSQGGF